MILIRKNSLLRPLEGVCPKNLDFLGPNGTPFTRCHLQGPKSLDFEGPPLSMALEMDLPTSKALRPTPVFVNV
jgi:hypothetical protein